MSFEAQCQDCGKKTDDLDMFMSCPECGLTRDVNLLAEEIAGEAVIQFMGHTCGHKHPNKKSAEKCEKEREQKYLAFVNFTAGIIKKLKNGDSIPAIMAENLQLREQSENELN